MPRKKKPDTEMVSYEITPEIHQRAIELLVDVLLRAAEEIGASNARQQARRKERAFPRHTAAAIVTELAAQMSVRLARHIVDGELLVRPTTPKP
jgi:hypothetical protein